MPRVRLKHEVLARRIADSRLSQNRWARKVRVSSGHLSMLVNGVRSYPSAEVRRKLLGAFHLEFDDLFEIETSNENISKGRTRKFEVSFLRWKDSISSDVRFAFRSLRRQPSFLLIVSLVLSLGLGANTALFSFVDSVLLQPLPYDQPDRLVMFWQVGWSEAEFELLRDQLEGVEEIAGYVATGATISAPGELPVHMSGFRATAGFLTVLGIEAITGRLSKERDGRTGNSRKVLLSQSFWERHFSGKSDIVGEILILDGQPHELIGIFPSDIEYLNFQPDFIQPIQIDPGGERYRGLNYLALLGRLSDDVSIDSAQAELDLLGPAMRERFRYPPQFDKFAPQHRLERLHDYLTGDYRRPLLWMMIAVALVLLASCLNTTGLFFVRLLGRRRELAVRSALGASRWRLSRQLLIEAGIVSFLSGVIALLSIAFFLDGIIAVLPSDIPRLDAVQVNFRVVTFAFMISLLSSLAVSLLPGLGFSRPEILPVLKGDSRTATGSKSTRQVGTALAITEISLAFLLVFVTGLTAAGFVNLIRQDLGFDPGPVVTFSVDADERGLFWSDRQVLEERARFYEDLESSLTSLPGVEAVGGIHQLPIRDLGWNNAVQLPQDTDRFSSGRMAYWRLVQGDYFQAMGISLKQGRWFEPVDRLGSESVCIVSERFVEEYLVGENPLGTKIRTGPDGQAWIRIVGVVENSRVVGLEEEYSRVVYRPFVQAPIQARLSMVVRSSLPPDSLVPSLRQRVAELKSDSPVYSVQALENIVSDSVAQRRALLFVLTTSSLSTLFLGLAGIYGLLAFQVRERRSEIGIRIAVGARRADILNLFMRRGVGTTLAGITGGALLSLPAHRLLADWFFRVSSFDWKIFAGVLVLFLLAGCAATTLPARRAAALDPNRVLAPNQ